MSLLTRLVVLVPTLTAFLGLLTARRVTAAVSRAVAVTGLALTAFAGVALALAWDGTTAEVTTLPALDAGTLAVPLHLQATGPMVLVCAVVGLVALGVQVFAGWYLREDDRYPVFAATVCLFTAAMLLVVLSGDLLLTLAGWEVMGWCSYLLIGHWSRKESARRAALKAFLVTRVADVGFLLGVVLLAAGPRSTAYTAVLAYWSASPAEHATVAVLAPLLLVVGVLGKSAMVPFHDWLPDAMEGPTPASALIHAATMVAAGTVVLAQLFPVLAQSGGARWLLGLSTAVTMVWAALLAFAQTDLKRLLAYSTLSQVALMLSALAVAPVGQGPGAGLFHLLSHAMFKALLFLLVGWLSVTVGGTAATALRGSVRGHLLVRPAMFIGLLSLAGVPPVVGFWSKEHVLAAAEAGTAEGSGLALVVLVAGLVTVVLTAAYCTRAWLVLDDVAGWDADRHRSDTATAGVRLTVLGLAALTLVGGLFGGLDQLGLRGHVAWWMALITVLLVAGAALAVWSLRTRMSDPAAVVGQRRIDLADNGFGVDRLYVKAVAEPVLALARLVVFLDREVVDGYVRGAAVTTLLAGRGGSWLHRVERSSTSLVWVGVGVVAVTAVGVALW